jgi:hypothetical protein
MTLARQVVSGRTYLMSRRCTPGELRPHVACLDARRRVSELAGLVAFRRQRWAELVRYLLGEPDVVFPHGTYRIRGRFLSAPGPLAPSV